MATSAGAVLGLMPIAFVTVAVFWIIIFKLTRYVSVASITAALALPLMVLALLHLKHESSVAIPLFSAVMAVVVIWRHRSNIRRLFNGTEPRFSRR